MSAKIFRDPLYNYISIDRKRDGWLIELLDTPEMQRLRRIHQLGVSYLTYPGADHNRLAHSLGVLHLMLQALQHVRTLCDDEQVNQARAPLLAAALVHDVGHGPFSHLFEPCLGIDHEVWSRKIILSEETGVHQVLRKIAKGVPATTCELIDAGNQDHPSWMKYLLSSQLDVDRLDYLRRDSLCTGAGYGHFDYYRLLTSFELFTQENDNRTIVWPEKAMLAIEEYIFARYYMYQNVYLHKTTRGFEQLLQAMWRRGKALHSEGQDAALVPAIRDFWDTKNPTIQQYLRIEEFTVLLQIQNWTTHPDRSLSDLARRFLARHRFAMVEPPPSGSGLAPNSADWERALLELVKSKAEYDPPEMYCLKDEVKPKYNQPYLPEKEADEQTVKTAIRVLVRSKPVEISTLLDRLRPITEEPVSRVRYYLPKDLQERALKLRADWQ